jgi:Ca-activated chloride channel family protein
VHLSALLDVDLVAVEQTDELTLLVELTAPTPAVRPTGSRPPSSVVLDRSGSMAGGRLQAAQTALLQLVDRLDPADSFGVVAFDDQVQLVVPAGPLADKSAVKQAIAALQPGGSTDLSAGYFRGLQEAQRVLGATGATLLLISDGRANAGVRDAGKLGAVADQHRSRRIRTTTLGVGLGYAETLLGRAGPSAVTATSSSPRRPTRHRAHRRGGRRPARPGRPGRRRCGSPGARTSPGLDVCTSHRRRLPTARPARAGDRSTRVRPSAAAHAEGPRASRRSGLVQVATLEFSYVALPDLGDAHDDAPVHVNVGAGRPGGRRSPTRRCAARRCSSGPSATSRRPVGC